MLVKSAVEFQSSKFSKRQVLIPFNSFDSISCILHVFTPSELGRLGSVSRRSGEKISHPESQGKISNLMITELCYSHIFDIERLVIQLSSRCTHRCVFRKKSAKNCFCGTEKFPGLSRKRCRGGGGGGWRLCLQVPVTNTLTVKADNLSVCKLGLKTNFMGII